MANVAQRDTLEQKARAALVWRHEPPSMLRVLGRLVGVSPRRAGGYVARCPVHPDLGYYLTIEADDHGVAAVSCVDGCTPAKIAQAAGADVTDVVARGLVIERGDSLDAAALWEDTEPRSRFRILSDRELEQLPPIQFLIEGVLPMAGLGAIYGPPSAGKSFLALDMACSVAVGAPWIGRRTHKGSVVYVAAEGSAGLRQRLAAWKKHQDIEGYSIDLHFLTEPANLLTPVDVAALQVAFQALPTPPVLVIFDTLHRSMPGGDENSAKDVGLVIEHADRLRRHLQTSVLLVHHTAKGSELERGSGSLRGGVDAMLYAKVTDGRRELRCEKAKDWPEFDPIVFELQPVGDSCVIKVPDEGAVTAVGPAGPERSCLEVLGTHFLDDGATFADWLDASGVPKTSFQRYRTRLVRDGYVLATKVGRGVRHSLTDSGRFALGSKFQRSSTSVPQHVAPLVPQVPLHFSGGPGGTEPDRPSSSSPLSEQQTEKVA